MILGWAVLAVSGVAAAGWLTRGALASWREQRSGLVYELTPRYHGALLRGGAALVAFGCLATGVLAMVLAAPDGAPVATAVSADARTTARPQAAPAAPAAPATAVTSPAAGPAGPAVPAASGGMVTIGRPHGGELLRGVLPGFPGQIEVWLPKQYPGRSAPLRTVLVLTDGTETDDVFQGLSAAVDSGRADPFVAVVPVAACSPAGAVDPTRADDALRHAVAARFHVDPDADGWGILGLDAGAPCAVAGELAHPASYRAAAALGGRYDALPAPGTLSAPGARTAPLRLLLADSRRDTTGQASASRLNAALTRLPHTDVRLSSAVRDFSVQRERFRLVRLAAGYLTEQFAAARR